MILIMIMRRPKAKIYIGDGESPCELEALICVPTCSTTDPRETPRCIEGQLRLLADIVQVLAQYLRCHTQTAMKFRQTPFMPNSATIKNAFENQSSPQDDGLSYRGARAMLSREAPWTYVTLSSAYSSPGEAFPKSLLWKSKEPAEPAEPACKEGGAEQ